MSVGGPQSTGVAPILQSPHRSDRATRLCEMSPTMTTRLPARPPSVSCIVNRSSSACVGCACAPSPALTTAVRSSLLAARYGAPEWPCRITSTSAAVACSVSTVSNRDSPFSALLPPTERLMTSADSSLPAVSNDTRVLVLAS